MEDGKTVLSNVVASQIEIHRPYYGIVPEIASRKHLEWINPVVSTAVEKAGMEISSIDAVAATYRPGLIGSLLVGLSFAKGLSLSLDIPFAGVDHLQAHLYAAHLEMDIEYPYLGLIVSGGHTLIAVVESFDQYKVLGTTIDDACGEALDKVAKYYDLGYPGGPAIEKLSKKGDPRAFNFPKPSLHKGEHRYDVSYSGIKTAAVHQLDQFRDREYEKSPENIAASFQKTAIDIIVDKAIRASRDTGISTLVSGGGVCANSYLRSRLTDEQSLVSIFPSLPLCTDNAAMVAGLACRIFNSGKTSTLDLNAEARTPAIKKNYP